MPKKILTIKNKRGLHARASAKFVKVALKFDAEVFIKKNSISVGATSIMGLMMLAAGAGCKIEIEAKGKQANEAIEALSELVNNKFDEEN